MSREFLKTPQLFPPPAAVRSGERTSSQGALFAYQNTYCFTTKHIGVFILLGFLGMQDLLVFSWSCLRRCYQLEGTIHTPYRLGRASSFYRCPQCTRREKDPDLPSHLFTFTHGLLEMSLSPSAWLAVWSIKTRIYARFNSEKLFIVGMEPSVVGCAIKTH